MPYSNTSCVPSITYPGEEPYSFEAEVTQSRINPSSWNFQTPPSLVTNPSMDMHSMMAMSIPSPYHPPQLHRANLSPAQINIGSNLPLDNALLAPPGQFPQSGYDAIARQIQEQPWSAHNPRASNTGGSRSPSSQAPVHYGMFREPGPSVDGPDSAYYSQSQPAHSVLSIEPDCYNQVLSPSVTLQLEVMNVESPPTESHALARTFSDTRSHISSRSAKSGKSSKQIKCEYPECSTISTCLSEHKKHKLRHDKPFRCEEPNCKRNGGFTTSNDLGRHQKSVHQIGLDAGSYRCASEHCKHPYKIWPRLDNFKQHIERMHKDEDHVELTKKSEFPPKTQTQTHSLGAMTVASGDTSFDVTGMDRSLSAAPAMDMPVGEHDHAHGSAWDRNAQHLAHQVLLVPGDRSAQVGSNAAVLHNQQIGPLPGLSNAPQTKAEQQRSAVSKLSQAVSTTSGSVGLEAFLVNMLHQATDCDTDTGEFTKSDALRAVQAFSNFIKQSPGASSTRVQRRMTQGVVSNTKVCPVVRCGFAVARDCDLRKHMKRHDRPYGCTYPKCYKRFGAKSDYKRHENSQHFQLEAWRCSQGTKSGAPCGLHFFRVVQFEAHLQREHGHLSPAEVTQLLVKNRMGKNCQVRFWCGFCEALVELKQQRNAAWDERFDHIAKHFDKEKKRIDDWICVEENKPKREVCRGMDRYVFEEEDYQKVDAEGEDDEDAVPEPPPDARDMQIPSPSEFEPPRPSPASQSQAYTPVGIGKRKAAGDYAAAQRQQRRRTETTSAETTVFNRYCCGCGYACGSFVVECENCAHALCARCSYVTEAAGGTDVDLMR